MTSRRFKAIIKRMHLSRIAGPEDLLGCSPTEVLALENRYGVGLPIAYRQYLELMGHKSGRLFTHDHQAVFYANVLAQTSAFRNQIDNEANSFDTTPPVSFVLPRDALIIAARLWGAWAFIRCNAGDDLPVWMVCDGEWSVHQIHASVYDWIEAWCAEAEKAIASGYFDQNPNGTTP